MKKSAERIENGAAPADQFRAGLDALIRAALDRDYTSYSGQDRMPTGNAYQSVRLGNSTTRGFRTLRRSALAGLPLKGSRVLDLGCNLGELSRLARDSGAAMVDGFEHDPCFVQIAQAVNALNGVTRVSFFQRDITDPAVYAETYDIVLSFSVFAYTRKVLPQIAAICRRVFVVETHKATPEWPREYIDPVTRHFPHYCIAQRTDWGRGLEGGARLLLVYAREANHIDSYIGQRMLELGDDQEGLRRLDVRRSAPAALARLRGWLDAQTGGAAGLAAAVARALAERPDPSAAPDYRLGASGLAYWLAYFGGYFQFQAEGGAGAGNIYVRYLRQAARDLTIDAFMRRLVESGDAALLKRVQMRFADTQRAFASRPPAPILVYNPMPADAAGLDSMLVDRAAGTELRYSHLDGYHRYASCLAAGTTELGYRVIWQPQAAPFAAALEKSPQLQERLFAMLVERATR